MIPSPALVLAEPAAREHGRGPANFSRHGLVRIRRISIRMLAALAIVGGSVVATSVTGGAPAVASDVATSCIDGVAVVVDFTDLGGKVESGCAHADPATGRAALLAAGFTPTDSQPGLICAINAMPDPCPETFDGSFWSYWHSTADSEWVSYQVGADSSDPAPGDIEGWRYNDGTTPPGIAPAAVQGALPTPTPTAGSDPGASDSSGNGSDSGATTTQDTSEQDRAAQNLALTATGIGFLVLVIAVIVVFAVRSRRQAKGPRD